MNPAEKPGSFPWTRGIYPGMYRSRLWTMRQYAGFGTAEESNARYRYLLSQGTTGLSVAFDLPTQIGLDPDHSLASGEVGRVGVSIASLADMRKLFAGIRLDEVSTSMTINSTASVLLAFYVLTAREQGANIRKLNGTIQNDILKEYIARGTYIYPPRPAMRIITDVFAWATAEIPEWNTISISGYHIREAGSTAVQEVAFTFANAIAYIEAAVRAGLEVDSFAPRLSFFFNAHSDFLTEIAKFRAARRLYARLMRERFGAKDDRSCMLRFHTQTAGSTLTAQQPDVNLIRTAIEAMAAVLGGTQSLHTNSRDEALGLPTEESARLALRTQQLIAYESGVTSTADPVGGSWYIEELTDRIENEALDYIRRIDAMGGALQAIEAGFIQAEIQGAAYDFQRAVESGRRVIVGVNRFEMDEREKTGVFRVDPEIERTQLAALRELRATRDAQAWSRSISDLESAAGGTDN
ncbi:MAG TPA: methylmalonyl-CoA mutase family protein, partial [Bryobacteraceae bacterium]|nr:methylmalonyl-CoA mutase family protein [Bryobacteraceae bacterium]